MTTRKKHLNKNSQLLKCFNTTKHITDKLIFLRRCLDQRPDINIKDDHGNTALHLAARRERVIVVKLLIKWGADVNARNKHGSTPLYYTIVSNRISVSELLLNKSANVNVYNKSGWTPLHLAVSKKNITMVELLLNRYANVNAQDKDGETPLHVAVSKKDISMVKLLLNRGANVNAQDNDSLTPLHLTVYLDDISIAKVLLSWGAHVNARNIYSRTPLYYAVWKNIYMLDFLISMGADVNVQDRNNETPLHYAILEDIPIVEILLSNGAKVNVQNKLGITPLHYAVVEENVDVVTLLINHGVDIMLRNMGHTPFFYAFIFNSYNSEILSILWNAERQLNHLPHNLKNQYTTDSMYNNKVKFMLTDTSGFSGQLYETKLVSLVFIRVLNHERIEYDNILLGANIDGIGAMDDICLRYRVRGQDRPVVLFIQAKETTKLLTDVALWNNEGDFSLQKYFKSYLLIMERFQVGNADPMFEGKFSDIDCHFVLYTPAKENLTKKNINEKANEIMHDIINTGLDIEPIQYNYDESDINRLASIAAAARDKKSGKIKFKSFNFNEYDKTLAQDFISKLWFYHSQAKEDEVERKVKNEISKYYNNEDETTPFKFEIHSNAIFMRSHDDIQKWWIQRNAAPYLGRLDDYFKHAKKTYLYEVWLTILYAIYCFGIDVDLKFRYYTTINQRGNSNVLSEDFNTMLCRLFTIINEENIIIPVNINLKHEVVNLLISNHNSRDRFPNKDLLKNQSFKYSKRAGTSEAFGVLLRIKMLCLVFLRMFYNKQIEIDPSALLGAKIRGITVMNDICLRYRVKGQHRPVAVFMHLKHIGDSEKGQLTDETLWSESQDLSLQKHFASYITIKDRYRVGNKDSFFQGKFNDVDCYFGLYVTAKESLFKKKIGNKVNKVMHDLINTAQNTGPFQYDFDEDDIDRLVNVTVTKEMENLGTVFLECLRQPTKFNPNLLANNQIKRYHVVMAREVLQPCDEQPDIKVYRLWQFRCEFFNSRHEHLVTLKKNIFKNIQNAAIGDQMRTLKIKLPLAFGNLDMIVCRRQAKNRIKAIASSLMRLLKLNKDTQIVAINDDNVGPGKTIEQGMLGLNGGMASAVGNLLIFDEASKAFMFDSENYNLPNNADLLLQELKGDKYKPFNDDLKNYRIKINIDGFPKMSLNGDDYDKMQARDFFNKFWFFCDQAKEDELEHILKEEMNIKFSNKNRGFSQCNIVNCKNVTDFISSYSYNEIQKWWLQINEPYINRASDLFERAELAYIGNLLQTVINYMYLRKIHTIDINIKRGNEGDMSEGLYSLFRKIIVKLFSLFNPHFNESIHFSSNSNNVRYETSSLKLIIHPELKWVALYLESMLTLKADYTYFVIAKADFSNGYHLLPKDGFEINELIFRYNGTVWIRDCFEEETENTWRSCF